MVKTEYLCIFNPSTREIEGEEEYTDSELADIRYAMYVSECYARKAPWTPYRGGKPFEFPKEEGTE